MRESILSRLNRLERIQSGLPCAIVQFSDGHSERLDFHEIAVAFSERNRCGIVSLEWEHPNESAVIFQLLSCPETWENLTNERTFENEQDKRLF